MRRIKELDIKIGKILKQKRIEKGVSLKKLADELGITFQQVQKYEKAENRISSSTLWEMSKILNISIMDFFKEKEIEIKADAKIYGLIKNYNNLDNNLKEAVCDLVRTLSKTK